MKIKRYDPDDFWSVPVYLPWLQPDLTPELVLAAEKGVGFKLPTEYVDLLRIQNGGFVKKRASGALEALYGIGPNYPNVIEEAARIRACYDKFNPEFLVPIDGGAHYYMFLDYRKNSNEPQVTWIDFEGETEEVLAESFKAYLYEDILNKREVREYLEPVYIVDAPVGEIKSALDQSPEFTIFDIAYNHSGFEQFRVEGEVDIICIVRDIYVRKGFVRASDPTYEKLKDLMPEVVKKVEVTDGYDSIIDVTNSYYNKDVLAYLKEKGFSVVPAERDFY